MVRGVPLVLGRPIPCVRIHNRICVPGGDFRGIISERLVGNRTPFGGPQGTTTNSLERGSDGITTSEKLSVFIFGIRQISNMALNSRGRDLSCLGELNFGAVPKCGLISGVRSTLGHVGRVNRTENDLRCSVSNTIIGISSFRVHHQLNSATGFPG